MTNPPPDPAAVRELRKLYASLPTVKCQRLCSNSCRTKIDMSTTERARVQAVLGAELPDWMRRREGAVCPLLDGKTCTVYGVRPLICRLWGVAEWMRCPHGCTPSTGQWLTHAETMDLMLHSFVIGGGIAHADLTREIVAHAGEHSELYRRMLAGDRSAADDLIALGRRVIETPE